MSGLEQSLLDIYYRLAHLEIPVMIGGSVAAMIYGEPRATLDLDLVIDAGREQANAISNAFPQTEFHIPPIDTLVRELSRPCGPSIRRNAQESSIVALAQISFNRD